MDLGRISDFVNQVAVDSPFEVWEHNDEVAGQQLGLRNGRFSFSVTGRLLACPPHDAAVEDAGDYYEDLNQRRTAVATRCIEFLRQTLANLSLDVGIESIVYGKFHRNIYLNGNPSNSQTIQTYVHSLFARILYLEALSAVE